MKKSLFFLACLSFASIHTAESNELRSMETLIIRGQEKVLVIMTLDTNPSTDTLTRTFTVEPFDQKKLNSCYYRLSANELHDYDNDIKQAVKDYISKEFNDKS